MNKLIPSERIEDKIYLIRGQRVMLDHDLADLYAVLTKNLNKAVNRNTDRFPTDFMFQLTKEEYESLRFQTGTLKQGQHSKYLPYVFTQEGVTMLSSVLRSKRAIVVNIQIMRTFVRLRQILAIHKELADELKELENKFNGKWGKHEIEIRGIFKIIRKMMQPPKKKTRRIGFLQD